MADTQTIGAGALIAAIAGVASVVVATAEGRGVHWSHLVRALSYPLVTLLAFRVLLARIEQQR